MRRTSLRRLLLCTLLLVGCDGCGGGEDGGGAASGDRARSSATAGGEGDQASAEGEDPGPPPEVRVQVETDRYDRVEVAVQNRGSEPARLAGALRVERKNADAFEAAGELILAPGCEAPSDEPPCVTLVPGAVLYPCECGGCDELGAGEHRFVARSCGGAHDLASDPVVLDR